MMSSSHGNSKRPGLLARWQSGNSNSERGNFREGLSERVTFYANH